MAYERHDWETGETISESKLNNIEDGIEENIGDIAQINEDLSEFKCTIFDVNSSIKAQALTLQGGWTFGRIAGSGSDISVNELPASANFYVAIARWGSSSKYAIINLFRMNTDNIYQIQCNNGTWASSWTSFPSQSQITSINTSLSELKEDTADITDAEINALFD